MLFYLCFFKCFMHIASGIFNRFLLLFFIYNYCVICENLPYIRRYKLLSAIVVFYNLMLFYGAIFRKVINKPTR